MELPRLRKTGSCQVRSPTCQLEAIYFCPGYWKTLLVEPPRYEQIKVDCYQPICLNCYPDHFKEHENEVEETLAEGNKRRYGRIPVLEQVQTRSEIAV